VPDLAGRWALVETEFDTQFNGSVPPGQSLPLVFDIVAGEQASNPVTSVMYTVQGTDGQTLTDLACRWDIEPDPPLCAIQNPDFDDGSHGFMIGILSPERIRLTDMGPMLSVGLPATGIAVRID